MESIEIVPPMNLDFELLFIYHHFFYHMKAKQGVTLRFQARGLKRSIAKNCGQEQDFCLLYILFRAHSLKKSRGPHRKLGAYAPGKVEPC